MCDEVNILWWWKIWRTLAIELSKKYPRLKINLIIRDKKKFKKDKIYIIKNIKILDYNDNIKNDKVCFYCISVNEKDIIKKAILEWKKVNRNIVLKENVNIWYKLIKFISDIKPSYLFIITNPVEIIAHFFKNKLDWLNVYWLWLDIDRQRIEIVFDLFFNIKLEEKLYILWNHSLFPVPILSRLSVFKKFNNITLELILENISKNNHYKYWTNEVDFYKEFSEYFKRTYKNIGLNDIIPIEYIYEIIFFFVLLLVKIEFNKNNPPVEKPVLSIVNTFNKMINNNELLLSYYSEDWIYTWWVFKKDWQLKRVKINTSTIEEKLIKKISLELYWSVINHLF